MSMYYFTAAVAFSVIPISFIFKIYMDRLKENPNNQAEIQKNFFIWVFISEIIPIIFVVFGFLHMAPAETMGDLLLPGILIIVIIAFVVFFVLLQLFVDVPEERRWMYTVFTMIAISLVLSFPIISVVVFIAMLPA